LPAGEGAPGHGARKIPPTSQSAKDVAWGATMAFRRSRSAGSVFSCRGTHAFRAPCSSCRPPRPARSGAGPGLRPSDPSALASAPPPAPDAAMPAMRGRGPPGRRNRKPAEATPAAGAWRPCPRGRRGWLAEPNFRISGDFPGADANFRKVRQLTRCDVLYPDVTQSQAFAAEGFSASSAIQTRDSAHPTRTTRHSSRCRTDAPFPGIARISGAERSPIEVQPPRPSYHG